MVNPNTRYKFRRLPHRKTYEKCKHPNCLKGYNIKSSINYYTNEEQYFIKAKCHICNKRIISTASMRLGEELDLLRQNVSAYGEMIFSKLYENIKEVE